MLSFAKLVGITILFFIPFWGCIAIRDRWNLAYAHYPLGFAAYFLLCSLGGIWFFRADFASVPINTNVALPAIIFLGTLLLTLGIYASAQQRLADIASLLQQYGPTSNEFVRLDYRYLLVKLGNVLYQQVALVLTVLLLHRLLPSVLVLALLFASLFGLLHLLIYAYRYQQKQVPRSSVVVFSVFSFLGGLVMPLLVLQVPFGFIYSFCIHALYYPVVGVGFRIYLEKRLGRVKINP
ncbi:MAG TPA: hypothetical protein VKT82_29045 [Ktedonobacterales bacterium]|nr:hypothetical protein [Ktedonobacterales bacterium]